MSVYNEIKAQVAPEQWRSTAKISLYPTLYQALPYAALFKCNVWISFRYYK